MMPSGYRHIAEPLAEMARQQPHRAAVICPAGRDRADRPRFSQYSFAQLELESTILARGLRAVGIGPGCRTVLMVPPCLDFFSLTFALFKAGAIPVLVDPGMGVRNLKRCLDEAAPDAFIGIQKAQLARLVLGWARQTLQLRVTVGGPALTGGLTLAQVRRAGIAANGGLELAQEMDAPAAILFTSGSTGAPKGVIYSQRTFLTQIELLRRSYGIEPGETDLSTFPLFALFGPALGMTAVIPEMDPTRPAAVNPRRIVEAIQQFGVTNMFGSPALIRRVGRWGAERGLRLPTLKRVISAGAPVPAATLELFAGLLSPSAEIHTPYGATEALPVATIGSREILGDTRTLTEKGRGVCVGRPVPGLQVAVIRIDDGPLPRWSEDLRVAPGEIGEICVRGPQVSLGYFRRPEAEALARIADPDGVWHRMGDLGWRDEEGRLWFCGRKAHRVVDGERCWFTIPCEAVFNVHPLVHRTALVGIGEVGRQRPVLCVELEEGVPRERWADIKKTLEQIAATHLHTKEITEFLRHPRFPVDIRHNAKIFREKLAPWATQELSR